jgi:hypothetical protein
VERIAGRLNWKQASIIMILATIIPPYTTFLLGFSGHEFGISIAVYALLWAIDPPGAMGFQILNYWALSMGLPLGFFNILFAFQVVRYTREEAGKMSTLIAGCLTLVLPFTSLAVTLPYMIMNSYFVYIGPIPIQLITGLFLMKAARKPEPTKPWEEDEKSLRDTETIS